MTAVTLALATWCAEVFCFSIHCTAADAVTGVAVNESVALCKIGDSFTLMTAMSTKTLQELQNTRQKNPES